MYIGANINFSVFNNQSSDIQASNLNIIVKVTTRYAIYRVNFA